MSPETAIDRVRSFIRWNGEKLEHLDAGHEAIADPVGWQRGQGDRREFWIKPNVWREIFDNNPDVSVDAARTLREIGLLRVQDTENCQAVVEVRKKSVRAYVVKAKILKREAVESYGAYGPAESALKYNVTTVSSPLNSLHPSDGQPPVLSALLS